MNITIRGIPEELHGRIKSAAEKNNRSVNKHVVSLLDEALTPKQIDRQELLERIDELRSKIPPLPDV